jgi:uncharacterized protein with HEPN domain
MWYIETLLREIESSLDSLNKKEGIYKHVEIDLSKEQILLINEQIVQLYSVLEKIQKNFTLKNEPIKASKIVKTAIYDILETICETWSSYMEKTSGKIKSVEEKKQIDGYLNEILQYTNRIKEITEKDDLKAQ